MPPKGGNPQYLKPAKKGEIRNPKGRQKGSKNMTTVLRDLLDANAPKSITSNAQIQTILGELGIKKPTNRDIIIVRLMLNAMKGDNRAVEIMLDRTEGKVKQDVNITATDVISVGYSADDGE